MTVTVLVREHLPSGVAGYGQYLASGKSLHVNYKTEDEYLEPWIKLDPNWWLSNTIQLIPLYKRNYIKSLIVKSTSIQHPRQKYVQRAREQFLEVEKSLLPLVAEINGVKDRGLIGAYLRHLLIQLLKTLAYLNERPFTEGNINYWAEEALLFSLRPTRYAELVEIHAQGYIWDLQPVLPVAESVIMELGELINVEEKRLHTPD